MGILVLNLAQLCGAVQLVLHSITAPHLLRRAPSAQLFLTLLPR